LGWQYSPLSLVLAIVTIILFGFTVFAWKRRHAPGIITVLVLFIAATLWSATSAVSLSSTDIAVAVSMDRLAFPAIVTIPVAYLLFVLWYTEQDYRPSRLFLALLFVIPVLSVFLVLTNDFHHLFYTGFSAIAGPRGTLIWVFTRGPLFGILASYSVCIVLAALLLLVVRYRTVGKLFRAQILLILAAGLVPVVATLFYYSDIGPETGFDWTPVSFVISGFALTSAMLAFELFTLQPLTQSFIVKTMKDGVISTTANGRITLINPAAVDLLGVSEDLAVGQDLAGFAPGLARFLTQSGSSPAEGNEITLRVNASPHIFEVLAVSTPPDGEHMGGYILTFRDVTDRKNAETSFRNANRKLNLLSSIVRHDIKNKLTALFIYLDLAAEAPDKEEDRLDLGRIHDSADGILTLINFTQEYQDLGVAPPSWQNVGAALASAGRQLDCSGIRLVDETAGAELLADPLFERVIYNLLDNAIRYAQGMTTFSVRCNPGEGPLVLRVEDDGPGIPLEDKNRIFDRGFGHNTGLGLFLVRDILGITGMTIRENGEPGKGARFEITVPAGAFRFKKSAL
jgi:PAS domain S-box-containing protein